MAGYQRYVYYIYNYEKGIKRGNVGSLRLEIRDNNYKFTTSLRIPSQHEPLNMLFGIRRGENLHCYPMDILPVENGIGSRSLSLTKNELEQKNLSLKQLAGILFYAEQNKFYATLLDDGDIQAEKIIIENGAPKETTAKAEASTVKEPAAKAEASTVKEPSAKAEAVIETKSAVQVESSTAREAVLETEGATTETAKEAKASTTTESATPDAEIAIETESAVATKPTDLPNPEKPADVAKPSAPEDTADVAMPSITEDAAADLESQSIDLSEAPEITLEDSFATRILDIYPKMYPFETDEIIDCVRIELQDIHEFPLEYWSLSHNSFVLQGYYSYRHLLFALYKEPGEKPGFVLGVPGICHVKQNFLAGMFGFPKFLPLKATEDINGEFGYWLHQIDTHTKNDPSTDH